MECRVMRKWIQIVEGSKSAAREALEPVEWPTNLSWRVQMSRFKNVDALCDIRRGKLFALPFKNWLGTYWNLLGKDVTKIRYMQTQVVEIPDSAMVADMAMIDAVFFFNGGSGKPMTKDGSDALDEYISKSVSYGEFKHDPYIFSRPEILIEPTSARFLPMKVYPTSVMDPDEALPTPILGIRRVDNR